jgi:hypothetical protein
MLRRRLERSCSRSYQGWQTPNNWEFPERTDDEEPLGLIPQVLTAKGLMEVVCTPTLVHKATRLGPSTPSMPTLTPWGLMFAALLLTGVAAFALRYRMRGR